MTYKVKKLFILADSPGSADFIFPVIAELLENFVCKIVTVKNSPTQMLAEFKPSRVENSAEAQKIFSDFMPDALLVGTSSLIDGPYVAEAVTREASLKKIPVVCYQDYWANHRAPMNRKMTDLWQLTLVPDVLAEKFLREDGYTGKVVITGYPALEKFSIDNVQPRRKEVRAEYGIADKVFLILYAGAATPFGAVWDEKTFNFFLDGASCLKVRPAVIVSPHPRDENPERYAKLAAKKKTEIILRREDEFSDDIIMGTDAVVGMYATPLIHACYLRIPAVSIMLPDAGKIRLQKIGLDDFPPNVAGAVIGIYEYNEIKLAEILERLRDNEGFKGSLREAEDKFLPHMKIKPSQIAANAIKKFLQVEG